MLTNMELIGQLKSMPGAMEVQLAGIVGIGWIGIEEVPSGDGTKPVIVLRSERPLLVVQNPPPPQQPVIESGTTSQMVADHAAFQVDDGPGSSSKNVPAALHAELNPANSDLPPPAGLVPNQPIVTSSAPVPAGETV